MKPSSSTHPSPLFQQALALKERTRIALANLPFEEKYEIIRSIQKRRNELCPEKKTRVWPPLD